LRERQYPHACVRETVEWTGTPSRRGSPHLAADRESRKGNRPRLLETSQASPRVRHQRRGAPREGDEDPEAFVPPSSTHLAHEGRTRFAGGVLQHAVTPRARTLSRSTCLKGSRRVPERRNARSAHGRPSSVETPFLHQVRGASGERSPGPSAGALHQPSRSPSKPSTASPSSWNPRTSPSYEGVEGAPPPPHRTRLAQGYSCDRAVP